MKSSGSCVSSFGVVTLTKLRVVSSILVYKSLVNKYLYSLLGGCFAFGLYSGSHKSVISQVYGKDGRSPLFI